MTSKTDSRVAFSPDMARNLSADGWHWVELLEQVGSTNAYAVEAAKPWHLVAAHAQSAGRGRMARSWQVPAGAAVSLSATMPLPRETSAWGWVPLFAGAAILAACERLCPEVELGLKWPNDLLAREVVGPRAGEWSKMAGILCQVITGPEPMVVVGVGLNVLQEREELPVDNAVSLALLGAHVTREEALSEIARQLRKAGLDWAEASARAQLRRRVRERCVTLGNEVIVYTPAGEKIRTRAEDIDDDGRLLTRSAPVRTTGGPIVEPAAVAYSVADIEHVRPVEGEVRSG